MAAPRMRDAFMMDFENACLQQDWNSSERSHPKGPRRFEDPQWATMMRQQCEGHSDVTFEQYCEWCLAGGGDEWFQEDEAMQAEQEDETEDEWVFFNPTQDVSKDPWDYYLQTFDKDTNSDIECEDPEDDRPCDEMLEARCPPDCWNCFLCFNREM